MGGCISYFIDSITRIGECGNSYHWIILVSQILEKAKEKREKNTDATIEIERKLDHGCNHINQHLSNDFVEALQLRIDSLKQEKLWKENKSRNVSLSLQCSDNIINKFQEKIEN